MKYCSLLLSSVLILSGCSKKSDPVPSNQLTSCFTVQSGTLIAQQNIQFTSCSKLANNWLWEFGDGFGSTTENPTHAYNSGGAFTVKLTTSDGKNSVVTTTQITVAKALVFYHPANTISHDSVWVTGLHIVTGTIKVNGAKLTIQPGAIVRFTDGADKRIEVGSTGFTSSTFIANGTATQPIQFISNSTNPVNSIWGAISIGPNTTSSSSISYATIKNGGGSYDYTRINAPVEFVDGGTIAITNTTISNSTKYGIYLSPASAFSTFTNNTIDLSSTQGYPIILDADNLATFVENTNVIKGKGILITDTNITTNVTFSPYSLPYYTEQNLLVGNTVRNTVTINAGCTFNFGGAGAIMINGVGFTTKFVVAGTAAKPVILQAADPLDPWLGIRQTSGFGTDSYMDYMKIYTAKSTNAGDAVILVDGNTKLNLTNSYVSGEGVMIKMNLSPQFGNFTGNTFDKGSVGYHTVWISGNQFNNFPTGNTFLHLTDDTSAGIFVSAGNINTTTFNITTDFTITNAGAPYFMVGQISLGNRNSPTAGPTLTIQPGVDLRFRQSMGFFIGEDEPGFSPALDAKLIMNGTSTLPIHVGVYPGYPSWSGLSLMPGTNAATSINYTTIEGSDGNDLYIGIGNGASATPYPIIQNSTFKNAAQYPIYVDTNNKPDIRSTNAYTGNGTNAVFYK